MLLFSANLLRLLVILPDNAGGLGSLLHLLTLPQPAVSIRLRLHAVSLIRGLAMQPALATSLLQDEETRTALCVICSTASRVHCHMLLKLNVMGRGKGRSRLVLQPSVPFARVDIRVLAQPHCYSPLPLSR